MPKKNGSSSSSNKTKPDTPSSSSQHQRFSRTKTGCFTCRARRKKCDEARDPQSGACARCRNSGIECLGFPPLKSAPASAHWKQNAAQARGSTSKEQYDHQIVSTCPIPERQNDQSLSINRDWQEDGVARWADLMALDDGEQLFYEGMFFDSNLDQPSADRMGMNTAASSRAISVALGQETLEADSPDSKQEDRALTVLSNFYAMVCWYRWQPIRRSYTKDQFASALKARLQRSEVLCISVASLAACYGFSDYITLPDNSIRRSFIKHCTSIYDVVTSTKTRKLCSFLEWLGETSNNGSASQNHITAAQTIRQGASATPGVDGMSTNKSQGETLFSLASRVLHQIAFAANQDQELPTDRSTPLDTAALIHVDKYLHAVMDLAMFAYASRSAQAFLTQLDSATLLLNSLLGRSQCVRLSDLQGIETTGLRTFVWADITNAVLSGRSTFLHYLSDVEADRLREFSPATGRAENDDDDQSTPDDEHDEADVSITQDGLQICFGCPDDVLVIMAAIANLHFQLLHARKSGALSGQGAESLPAWALHAALDLSSRLDMSQKEAPNQQSRGKQNGSKTEHHSLGRMWRHAAYIYLHTTIYRQGPISASNQQNLHSIMSIYREESLRPMTIAMGDPAMPLLFAAFVAVSSEDRKDCLAALQEVGQREVGRSGYRRFVERLYRRSEETGFGILWQDLLMSAEETIAIM